MKERTLSKAIEKALKTFPALVVTGPRQSGKTTLLRRLLADTHSYVNMEDADTRARAAEDPRGFLDHLRLPVILDEIQYVPELLSYIKSRIDEQRGRSGQWVITGSQHFSLMQGVTESLAGRVAVFSLLPFSFAERTDNALSSVPVANWLKILKKTSFQEGAGAAKPADVIFRGSYPEVVSKPKLDVRLWGGSYFSTYVERDIRTLSQVADLRLFEQFLKMCAIRTGQILNLAEISNELGLSLPTAKRWLSLLEIGYQVMLLQPYSSKFGKRLIKSPKIYFTDTALACYLMGLTSKQALLHSPQFPHLFETMVVTDIWKRFLHAGHLPMMYYLRTRDGLEVDTVLDVDGKLHLIEIKSSATILPKHAAALHRASLYVKDRLGSAFVISQAKELFPLTKGVVNYPWQIALGL